MFMEIDVQTFLDVQMLQLLTAPTSKTGCMGWTSEKKGLCQRTSTTSLRRDPIFKGIEW